MTAADSVGTPTPITDRTNLASLGPESEPVNIGRIVAVSGARARVLLDRQYAPELCDENVTPFIGTLLSVDAEKSIVLGMITEMTVPAPSAEDENIGPRFVEMELVGELIRHSDGYLSTFRRGISVYPRLGDRVSTTSREMLKKVYLFGEFDSVSVGQLQQDPTIPAVIKVDDMLGKHFAIVGSTGSGKSCAVALILRQVLEKLANAHIVMLDPHNEYGTCFGDKVEKVKIGDLQLPYWLLTFEEAVEILIGDARKYADEVEILREIIPIAKRQYSSGGAASLLRTPNHGVEKYSVDVPVPYRISDVLELINIEMGRLEKRKEVSTYQRLKARIETIIQDPRYAFMFGSMSVQDNLAGIIKRLFRIPVSGKPITVMQLMGLPSEVVNVVVSVMARLAFDIAMWSDGKIAITLVCEEAHRYVPRVNDHGFEPTKRAISRIAKEGRKYGCSLCIVTQRPGDVDPTILSQCSTLFTMRLSNERDQSIVESALSDSSASLTTFLPALATRETIVFGEGVPLPSRIVLGELPVEALPRGSTMRFADAWANDTSNDGMLSSMISRWRLADAPGPDQIDRDVFEKMSQRASANPPPAGGGLGSIEEAVDSGLLWSDSDQIIARDVATTQSAPAQQSSPHAPQQATATPGEAEAARPEGLARDNWRAEMLRKIANNPPAE